MLKSKHFVLAVGVILALLLGSMGAWAQDFAEIAPGIPRHETLILENPEGRIADPDRFNRWAPGGGASTGLQQLALDTLWFVDPNAGIDGEPWNNALASEGPIYNEDFTQMTVKLREGIYWSDGVPFTADDVVFTVETLRANPGMSYHNMLALLVDEVYKTDDYTVVFDLTRANSRFHAMFTVRWAAMFIMPKHIWETVEDPLAFDFNPPVSLGPYVLKDFDPTGHWYLWERREDWERTSLGMQFGMPAPKYALYTAPGPADQRVMAQANQNLDVIHDLSPEGVQALLSRNPTSRGWFPGFPWAHPDPTLPAVIINHEVEPLGDNEVRWALQLAIDIAGVSMASYSGAATVSALHVPPTGMYKEWYFDPMEEWLLDYTIELAGVEYQPYNPDATLAIAEMVRPTLGDQVPTDEAEIKQALGYGWWNYDPDMAEKILLDKGFTRNRQGNWLLPDGTPWTIDILCMGASNPTMTRVATMIAEQWTRFGVQSEAVVSDQIWDRMNYGDFETAIAWSIETWGGHHDFFFFLESWHSDFWRPSGELATGTNRMRWQNDELDQIIDEIRSIDFDDPRGFELGMDFLKLAVEETPLIPLMSYNVFAVMDTYFWEGWPSWDNPYANPVANWSNTRFMFPMIRPTGRQ